VRVRVLACFAAHAQIWRDIPTGYLTKRSPGIEMRCIMRNRSDHAGLWWWVAAIALRNAGQTEARAKKL
jgi:hypothetical protein